MTNLELLVSISVCFTLILSCFVRVKTFIDNYKIWKNLFAILLTVLLVFMITFNGIRWQFLPLLLTSVLLCLYIHRDGIIRTTLHVSLVLGGITFSLLSIYLLNAFSVQPIKAPGGSYAIGTFSTTLIDQDRVERYDPDVNRALNVQVWYPSEQSQAAKYAKQTLFPELYSGDFDLFTFLFSYLKRVETNSYVNAPMATGEKFPLVLFNHGLYLFPDQSPQLMEHFASNGYIVISLTHPYESAKVSLKGRGTAYYSMEFPTDVGFTNNELIDGGIGSKIDSIRGQDHAALMRALYTQIDLYNNALNEQSKAQIVRDTLGIESIQKLGSDVSDLDMESFFRIRSGYRNRSTRYWVEDNQFVLRELENVEFPIEGFVEQIDFAEVGLIGFSYGGSAVGEFCKIDYRCKAGINIDGTQFGSSWNQPTIAPFLLINSDTNPGGNSYAYYPAPNDFYEIHIPGTEHPDFIDSLTHFTSLRELDLAGEKTYQEVSDLTKRVSLAFFDEFLRSHPGKYKEEVNTLRNVVVEIDPIRNTNIR